MSVWQQDRVPGLPGKWALGSWLSYRKLASAAYVPGQRERVKLRFTTPYWHALNFSLAPRGNAEDRVSVTNRFWVVALVGSNSLAAGFRVQFFDSKRKQRFSYSSLNQTIELGSAQRPFLLRKLYLLRPNSPLLVRVQNQDTAGPGNNAIQVVLFGYME